MNIKVQHYLLLCLIAFLASCSAPKEVLYLQDIASIKEENIDKNYEVIIHKDDLLAILVNSKDPELALPFNMPPRLRLNNVCWDILLTRTAISISPF